MTTRFSEKAITPARLMATNVFPSPEIVDVMAITFEPGSLLINCKLVRTDRNDSEMADFGFLSTSNCEIGPDGWLYVTVDSYLCRVKTTAQPIAIAPK